jgi:DNA-binding winged helix-turn-helix (wHTH) protein/Tfp pilus assembly protein PilF
VNCAACSRYRFGAFTLDLHRETLVHHDQEIRLRPKCYQVLKVLVEHHGRLVTKEDLHEAVWAPAVVGDDSLAHCLIEIRRALGPAGRDMISTVPRRGYMFEPDVVCEDPVPPIGESPPGRRPQLLIAAAVLATLAAIAFGFRPAPIAPADNAAIEDSQRLEVAAAPLTGSTSPPVDFEKPAYRHYAQGRFFYDRRAPGDVERAEKAYRRAVEIDPSLAAAWTGLAAIYNLRLSDDSLPGEEALYRMGEAAHRAVALDPEDGEALARMATYLLRIGQTRLAEEHFARAIALEPDNALLLSMLAGRLMHAGRLDEAIALQRRASALAPVSPVYSNNLVSMLRYAGHTAEALDELERLQALWPLEERDHASFKADLLVTAGRYEEALSYALVLENAEVRDSRLAIIYHALGSEAKAQAAFERLETSDSVDAPYHLAEVLTWRGEVEKALHLLNSAGDPEHLRSLATRERLHINGRLLSPLLAPLRAHPQWQALSAATQPDMPLRKTLMIAVRDM